MAAYGGGSGAYLRALSTFEILYGIDIAEWLALADSALAPLIRLPILALYKLFLD